MKAKERRLADRAEHRLDADDALQRVLNAMYDTATQDEENLLVVGGMILMGRPDEDLKAIGVMFSNGTVNEELAGTIYEHDGVRTIKRSDMLEGMSGVWDVLHYTNHGYAMRDIRAYMIWREGHKRRQNNGRWKEGFDGTVRFVERRRRRK